MELSPHFPFLDHTIDSDVSRSAGDAVQSREADTVIAAGLTNQRTVRSRDLS